MPVADKTRVDDETQVELKVEEPEPGRSLLTVATRGDTRELLLAVEARISVEDEQLDVSARADSAHLRWTADVSQYDETHHVFILGTANGYPFSGTVDPRTGHTPLDLRLERWVSEDHVERIRPVEQDVSELLKQQLSERQRYDSEIADLLAASAFRRAGAAGSWGLGAAAAAVLSYSVDPTTFTIVQNPLELAATHPLTAAVFGAIGVASYSGAALFEERRRPKRRPGLQ